MSLHLLLFDGDCGLCNRLNRFVAARDRSDAFRFAPLQGPLAHAILARHGHDATALDTLYAIADFDLPSERVLARSDAAAFVLRELGGFWRIASWGHALPPGVRDAMYNAVARHRYRWFGHADACPAPTPELRRRLLEE